MAAVGLSVWLVDRLKPLDRNLSTIQSTSLTNSPDHNADVLRQLLVVQAMHQTFLSLPSTMSVLEAGLALTNHQSRSALVVDASEQLVGLVTLQDIHRAISRWETYCHTHAASDRSGIDLTTQTLDDICTKDLLYAHEDERIHDALARMSARGLHQLPVVDRHNNRHIIGLLEQEKITLLCSLTLMQQSLHPYVDIGKNSADDNEMPTAELMSLPQA
jgi:CBS domain-containing protein